MNSLEKSRDNNGTAERLTARFAVLWEKHRRLAEEWRAVESSTAWAVARRLVRWRRFFSPKSGWRQTILRLILCGLRLERRQWKERQARSAIEGTSTRPSSVREGSTTPSESPQSYITNVKDRRSDKLHIAFIGSRWAFDAATMRYRAHNLIEALPLIGMEGTFVSPDEIPSRLSTILSHDMIVLVRRVPEDIITSLIGMARRRGLPIIYDIDDYIFDPWVLPYVEAFQDPADRARYLRLMDDQGACLELCDYFTGSTSYLAAKAGALGKESFVIHNGLNTAQLSLSQSAREQRSIQRSGHGARIGYFSGTRTHQADFRIVYPALMRLLSEERETRLTIVGHLDVGAFPGLAPFMDQIDILPTCHWSELPGVIAGVDINVIPLELTPFNEGKSNLKYYEAGLVEVPSVASPTGILRDSIAHGHNGLLARTPEEWYDNLKELIARPDRRRQMGQNALEHVLRNYSPPAIAAEAAGVYRQILLLHRDRNDSSRPTLSIVMLVTEPDGQWVQALRRANELAALGNTVTVHLSPGRTLDSSATLAKSTSGLFLKALFALQHDGEIPCCDVLIAIDPFASHLAKANQHRARLTIADADRSSTILGVGRGLESLLRDWVQGGPPVSPPSHAA